MSCSELQHVDDVVELLFFNFKVIKVKGLFFPCSLRKRVKISVNVYSIVPWSVSRI